MANPRRGSRRTPAISTTRQSCDDPLNLGSSRRGRSPDESASPGYCHRWDRSTTALTTLSSNRFGDASRSRSSTGNAGGLGSSWPTPSSSTSRSSTTANAATKRSGCSPRSNMRHSEPNNPWRDRFKQPSRARSRAHHSGATHRPASELRSCVPTHPVASIRRS